MPPRTCCRHHGNPNPHLRQKQFPHENEQRHVGVFLLVRDNSPYICDALGFMSETCITREVVEQRRKQVTKYVLNQSISWTSQLFRNRHLMGVAVQA